MKSPIKDLASVDVPSSLHGKRLPRQKKRSRKRKWARTLDYLILIAGILFVLGVFAWANASFVEIEDRPVAELTVAAPSYQDTITAMKTIMELELREEGMLIGECGIFRCSKRWKQYMDSQIIRAFGR